VVQKIFQMLESQTELLPRSPTLFAVDATFQPVDASFAEIILWANRFAPIFGAETFPIK